MTIKVKPLGVCAVAGCDRPLNDPEITRCDGSEFVCSEHLQTSCALCGSPFVEAKRAMSCTCAADWKLSSDISWVAFVRMQRQAVTPPKKPATKEELAEAIATAKAVYTKAYARTAEINAIQAEIDKAKGVLDELRRVFLPEDTVSFWIDDFWSPGDRDGLQLKGCISAVPHPEPEHYYVLAKGHLFGVPRGRITRIEEKKP